MADHLYPFQIEGVDFLVKTKRALLGDDMGLGKTAQAITACKRLNAQKILVICPNSVKYVWQREFEKWEPSYDVRVVVGDKQQRLDQIWGTAQVVVINFEIVREWQVKVTKELKQTDELKALLSQTWDVMIIDEAHRVKSRHAQVTKAVTRLARQSTHNLFLLTGTPIMNRPDELWTLLRAISPKQFTSYWRFVQSYCHVYHDGFGWVVGNLLPYRVAPLREVLSHFAIRRTKNEVLQDLPEKTVQQVWVNLENDQLRVYREMAKTMWTELEGKVVSAAVVIAQITRLKQIAIDPKLMLSEDSPLEGAKVDALGDILEGAGDQKVVVFSQFARALRKLSATLKIPHAMVTGDVTGKAREDSIQRFQTDSDCRVLLASIPAGGQGITLTAASIAVFLDKAWTPAMNIQAQDRLHRIGQKKPVTIIELLAAGTVEEGIEKLLNSKIETFRKLFELDWTEVVSQGPLISKEELRELLRSED